MVSQIAINAAKSALNSLVSSLMSSVQSAMSDIFSMFGANFGEYMDTFWAYDLRPGLASQTAQLHTMTTDSSRAYGSFLSAGQLTDTKRELEAQELRAHRTNRPSELQCEAATLTGSLQRMNSIKKGYARAAPIEKVHDMEASADDGTGNPTPAAQGPEVYQAAVVANYCTRYHSPAINNGNGICAGGPGTFPDEDLNAANMFTDTYDVTDANLKQNLDDFVRNVAGMRPVEPVNPQELNTSQGRSSFMKSQEYLAQQQLAYAGMYRVVSCIVPGSQMDPALLQAHRGSAGVDPLVMSDNPSWCEIERAILESSSDDLQSRLASEEPENVDRFLATMGIYQLTFGMAETSDLMDYSSAIQGVQGARQLKAQSGGIGGSSKTLGSSY
ncbi:MAG: hypothetical protein EP349_10135 [Alphaproteobacteria bacterium]|nr:MAG: hypothetical protein EP349_10135 [Alphaproteobacteria bacterium]